MCPSGKADDLNVESTVQSDKFMSIYLTCILGFAGHRARDPPDPIPNSEVKPRSVSGVSVVFGHAKLGKLAAPLPDYAGFMKEKY